MADALCGPSNALSTFQKHSSVDRTLQQDRLVSQRSQEQGFRSAPGINAGILDAEFEAFQAGPLPQLHDRHQEHPFQNTFPAHGPPQSFQRPQPQLSGWASDFQNMNLNDVQPFIEPASQFQQNGTQQPSAAAAWHQDFMQQPAVSQPQQTRALQFRRAAYYPTTQYPQNLIPSDLVAQENAFDQIQKQEQYQDIDDALFEKHFEAAALEMDQAMGQAEANLNSLNGETSQKAQNGQAFDNATLLGPSIQRMDPIIDAGLQEPIGSDRIHSDNKGKGKERETLDDADELARTAGNLLENVKHDQSQKFKQSNFLSLMRQLRDREVRVEGDKLVDVSMPSLSF